MLPAPNGTGNPQQDNLECSDAQGGTLNGTYANDPPIYRAYGIPDVIPIPRGQKSPPPIGFTGNKDGAGHTAVSGEHVAEWSEKRGDDNIAIVAQDDQQVVDLDNYESENRGRKAGDALRGIGEIEERTGCEYPPTYCLFHRDDGSAKFLYRCTPGVEWRGDIAPGVEIISHNYRYVHAGVNPKTGKAERWGYGSPSTGVKPVDGPVPPDKWAMLPEPLECEHAADDNGKLRSLATTEQAQKWLDSMPNGTMGYYVGREFLRAVENLSGVNGAVPHDVLKNVRNLVEFGAAGLPGAATALTTVEQRIREVRKPDPVRAGDIGEFQRMLDWAAKRCDPSIFHALRLLDKNNGRIPGISNRSEHAEPTPAGDPAPTWAPVDMRAARADRLESLPTIGRRVDGECLFYAGKVHSVHGETESGKSWIVQYAAAQCVLASDTDAVLCVDFEDNAADVGDRLVKLGVPAEVVDDPARYVYVRPSFPLSVAQERAAFDELLNRWFRFAVVDGVTEAMALSGLSTDSNTDVAAWQLEQPRAIASRTGAAVACIDHVTKDADTRGRHAIGSQHKLAGLDGAAFVVEIDAPFGEGEVGVATIRLAKDRPGKLRGRLGVDYRPKDHTHVVAKFRHDATDPEQIIATLDAPIAGQSQAPRGKAHKSRRPTWQMEQVSKYWAATADTRERSKNKTVDAMARLYADDNRRPTRQGWRDAIGLLVDEGFAKYEDAQRGGQIYYNIKPYIETEDPNSSCYTPKLKLRATADESSKT
jgi:hypothetical protein